MTLIVLVLAWDTVRWEQDDPRRAALRSVPWLLLALAADQVLAVLSVVRFWGNQPGLGDRWHATLLGGGSGLLAATALLAAARRFRRADPCDQRWELLAGLAAVCLGCGGATVWLAW